MGAAIHSREYTDYMRSDAWDRTKAWWFGGASTRSRRCRARSWRCQGAIHLHHRRYWRAGRSILGRERRRDLVPLCQRHHTRLHGYQHRRHLSVIRASRHYLWAARVRHHALLVVAVAGLALLLL